MILFSSWQLTLTTILLMGMIVAMAKEWLSADIALPSILAILLVSGVISPSDAFAGFSNHGLLAIAALFVVAKAVQESGGLGTLANTLMGNTTAIRTIYARMIIPITTISAFLNNTPVVAMFVPPIRSWADRHNIAPSKLLIPLSYASILGGLCTLVGTATNLVVSGLMQAHGADPIGMFEISRIGVPAAVTGGGFLILFANKLLPDRKDFTHVVEGAAREYLVDMTVLPNCQLVGKTVEEGGLRGLKGLFLVHVERGDSHIGPVSPNLVIRAGDRLRFTGLVSTIVDLKSIKGLAPVEDEAPSPGIKGDELRLFEVVVATGSPLVGQSVREASFRTRYEATVIAVHRQGHRIDSKIGDIILKPGDTLMLEAPDWFARKWYNSTHFYLVSKVGDVTRIRHNKSPFVLLVILIMVALPALGILPMVVSAFFAAALLVIGKAITPASAKRAINLSIIIVIASALGIGQAIEQTGLARIIAGLVINTVAHLGPIFVLAAVMILTNIFTELVTNMASAAMFFPVALEAAHQLQFAPEDPQTRAFQICIALAAAASFATPLGYQTNLIVYGPGGYRYSDFLKIGLPMNAAVLGAGILAAWLFYF